MEAERGNDGTSTGQLLEPGIVDRYAHEVSREMTAEACVLSVKVWSLAARVIKRLTLFGDEIIRVASSTGVEVVHTHVLNMA